MGHVTEIETEVHCWGAELWHRSQLDRPMGQLPLQLPEHAPRFFAPDKQAAQKRADEIAVAKGPGWSAQVSQHHRFSCCRRWEA